MTTSTATPLVVARAHAPDDRAGVADSLAAELTAGLAGRAPGAVLVFASTQFDPAELVGSLGKRLDGAPIVGCSTAGEFTDTVTGTGGVSAVALPAGVVARAAAAVAELGDDASQGTRAAVTQIEARLGTPLRSLDPTRHLVLVLIDGMNGAEEAVNEELGNAAPLLNVVGGSAGDDLAFAETWVAAGGSVSRAGAAILVLELAVPFRIVKSCSFEPTGRRLRITKADAATRTVHELDGRPALEVYAEAAGVAPGDVGSDEFMTHPVGLMIDGQAWIRSPQAVDGTSLRFYAQILEGMDVEFMRSTDLIAETRTAVGTAVQDLDGDVSGAVMFNCILRRLEMEAAGLSSDFVEAFDGLPTGGFHTYGETWLGHVNQTLTGVVFGR